MAATVLVHTGYQELTVSFLVYLKYQCADIYKQLHMA